VVRKVAGGAGAGAPSPDGSKPGRSSAGPKIALGRTGKDQTVTVLVSETTLAVEFDDDEEAANRRIDEALAD
jgi:hypothetical protein